MGDGDQSRRRMSSPISPPPWGSQFSGGIHPLYRPQPDPGKPACEKPSKLKLPRNPLKLLALHLV